MNIELAYKIKTNPLIYNYLRENSIPYKALNRGQDIIKELEDMAKIFYKETKEDKLEKFSNRLNLIKTFMDVIN